MKKIISIFLIAALLLSVTACSTGKISKPTEEDQSQTTLTPSLMQTEETVEEVIAAQKAAAMVPEDITNPGADWFYMMNDEIQAKYQDILALAEEKDVIKTDEFYGANEYLAVMVEAMNNAIDEIASNSNAEDNTILVYTMLELWNELDDFENNFDGYLGLIQALAKGNDYFNMADDSVQMPTEKGWPQDLFFSEYVPQCFGADHIYYCDEYLQGYGMEDPLICSMSKNEMTISEASDVCNQLATSGMFYMVNGYEDSEESCYAAWAGSYLDEENHFVFANFLCEPKLENEYIDFRLPGMLIPGKAVMLVSNFNLSLVTTAAFYAAF